MNTQTQEAPSMNDNWFEKTTRKVHIDFHTPEFPEEAIQNFDADKFINTIVDANFQAAVLFTKCHHGNSYYNTSVGHKHSGMSGDMFGEQIKAARKKGLKVFAYYSVGWDERSIAENPDWGLVTAAGESCFYKHWQWMCINSPYTTELILPQLKEIVTQYEPDGLWLDILSGGCCCAYCQDQHMAAYGREVDRDDASYLKWIKSSRKKFLQDVKDMATAIKPDIVISANSVGVLEDSRDDCESADFLILESGYSLAGISEEPGGSIDNLIKSKQGQNFDQTLEICSTRFVHSWAAWGDIKPVAQMQIQAAEIIAHGAVLNLGDQASPDGTLEPAVYKTMKQVMDFVAEREDYCIGGKSVASIAVLSHGMDNGLLGASHMLLEMGRHFDLLSDDNLERIHEYEVVLIPERDQLNKNQLSDRAFGLIKDYVSKGGKLITSATTFIKDTSFRDADMLGVDLVGSCDYGDAFLELSDDIRGTCPDMPLIVRGDFLKMSAHPDSKSLSALRLPLIKTTDERQISHQYAPPGERLDYPAISSHAYGEGEVIVLAGPIFGSYWQHHHWHNRELTDQLLKRLIPVPLVEVIGPVPIQVTIMRQGDRLVVHLTNTVSGRPSKSRMVVEKLPVLRDIKVLFRKDFLNGKVTLAPEMKTLDVKEDGDVCSVSVPTLHIHSMLVIE